MMKHLLGIFFFSLIFLYTAAQNGKSPFSSINDNEFEQKLIQEKRNKILTFTSSGALQKQIKEGDKSERVQAIELLGYIANNEGRLEIERILLDATTSVEEKIICIKALSIIRSPLSQPVLSEVTNDTLINLRVWAALALSLLGEKEESLKTFEQLHGMKQDVPYYSCHIGFLNIASAKVKPFLLEDINNPDPYVSIDAAIILAQLGFHPEALEKLSKEITNEDPNMRMAALRGLAYIGDGEALEIIRTATNDENILVRERAKTILEKFN